MELLPEFAAFSSGWNPCSSHLHRQTQGPPRSRKIFAPQNSWNITSRSLSRFSFDQNYSNPNNFDVGRMLRQTDQPNIQQHPHFGLGLEHPLGRTMTQLGGLLASVFSRKDCKLIVNKQTTLANRPAERRKRSEQLWPAQSSAPAAIKGRVPQSSAHRTSTNSTVYKTLSSRFLTRPGLLAMVNACLKCTNNRPTRSSLASSMIGHCGRSVSCSIQPDLRKSSQFEALKT